MTHNETAMDLLEQRVPLSLLFDLAGFGPSSRELLLEERRADSDPVQPFLDALAS